DSPYFVFLWYYLNTHQGRFGFRVIDPAIGLYTTADNVAVYAFRGADYHPNIVVFYEANNDMFPAYSDQFQSDYSHWRKSFDLTLLHRLAFFDYMPYFFDRIALYSLLRHTLLFNSIR